MASGCTCLLYTSDAGDELLCVDLGGRGILEKKKTNKRLQLPVYPTLLTYTNTET